MSDRKKAIENLETLKAFLDINGVFTISDAMKKSIDFAIASLKTDEAYQLEYERTAGHWNEIPMYKDIAWQCSECEHFTTWKYNFCPHCGADMRKVEK